MDFRLPNLGEGIEGGTITSVLVKVGDSVKAGQNVVSIETDKAAVEVPAESDGVVEKIHVKPGDKVPTGGMLLTLQAGGAANTQKPKSTETPRQAEPAPPKKETPKQEQPAPVAEAPRPSGGGASADFNLPNLGEGIEGGTITAVFVKPGDAVKAGQNVVSIETDKAAVEVPAESDGVVEAVHVKPGDKVPVGGKLLTLKASGAVAAPAPSPKPSAPKPESPPPAAPKPTQPIHVTSNGSATAPGT